MPELPDLQVFSRNLDRQLAGKKLKKIVINKRAKLNVPATALKAIEETVLNKVYREGKELRFLFKNKHALGLHLMLRGKLQWKEDGAMKYSVLELYFAGGKDLVLTDYQYNARINLDPKESEVPDTLSPAVNEKFWQQQLQSGAAIKKRLLDQQVVRGIGNAYADEILWDARISPFSISKKVPPARIKALARSVRKVLKHAESQISKTQPGIIGGEIRDFLLIHNPKKKKSPGGARIQKKQSGSRPTYYTNEQKLFK